MRVGGAPQSLKAWRRDGNRGAAMAFGPRRIGKGLVLHPIVTELLQVELNDQFSAIQSEALALSEQDAVLSRQQVAPKNQVLG